MRIALISDDHEIIKELEIGLESNVTNEVVVGALHFVGHMLDEVMRLGELVEPIDGEVN